MSQEYDYLFKVVLLGEPRVGKTSLIVRYLKNIFSSGEYAQTLGANFLIKRLNVITEADSHSDIAIPAEKRVLLQIWDLAGHMRTTQVKEHFYRGAAGCLLVYDVENQDSYDNLALWYGDVKKKMPNAKIAVLANKLDLCEGVQEVQKAHHDLQEIAKEFEAQFRFGTSAKTGENVEEAFTQMTRSLVQGSETRSS
ncbi:MAG: GTP-binding protein [Candidatus Bathyarchaeota archaeon]|nr:MAG: GTP-binding protein [Candidatus Bathyarchaeota archaeon]